MKRNEVKDVITCLGNDRRVLYYFKDRYCFDLIELYMEQLGTDSLTVKELKSSCLSRVMKKPMVCDALQKCGNGKIDRSDIQTLWSAESLPFVLKLTGWGSSDRGWDQTSRNQCNLVLQLNFDGNHIKQYKKLVKPKEHYGPFEYWGHPVSKDHQKTMSWVRLDIDFDTNEVLIEEIQNDWLRKATRAFNQIKKHRIKKPTIKPNQVNSEINGEYDDLQYYIDHILSSYQKIWAEASMAAAIRFIRQELGIKNIYYHSFDTGKKIKAVCGSPPRSMYTQLPKQFGFELISDHPEFLVKDKVSRRYINAIRNPQWFKLAV